MRRKQHKWLLTELERWQEKGIVDDETKDKIKTYYKSEGVSEGVKLGDILGVLGIILIGLGIILILAKNWSFFPRTVKVVISLLPFVCGSLGGFVVLKRSGTRWLKEGISIFITIGIVIGLVMNGQIYHRVETEWILYMKLVVLSLPLIYLYQSTLTLAVYLLGGTLCMFDSSLVGRGFIGLVIIGAILPYVIKEYKKASHSIMTSWGNGFVIVAGFGYITAMLEKTAILPEIYILYFIALIMLDSLLYEGDKAFVIRPFAIIGNIGIYITLFILSFNISRGQIGTDVTATFEIGLMVLLLVGVIIGIVGLVKMKREFTNKLFVYVVGATVMIGCRILNLVLIDTGMVLTILVNIIFILLTLMIVREGIAYNNMISINTGLVLLGALILARFFDSDISFLVKGLAFIFCGIVFLMINIYMLKGQKARVHHHENE